ncbi:hypothetical protein Hypma_015576 [Hypsizygus marmoreus]|uniref:Carbohydrate kinase PfkB domain-containing protein n=1 Tax=Hypsizygus marmoreus TaxID=39966 RepID=A0A369K5D4_HYPMA|nr:hypothetical protein Hypma_015576 [Hypsizygus marmoreus]
MLLSALLKLPTRGIYQQASRCASTWSQLSSALERNAPLDVHPEVQEALATNQPVVALETTLVTHGFPYPENLELSKSLEQIVRSTGSIPATIGMIGGRVKIGMGENHLQQLAEKKTHPVKISRRDIAPAIAMKADGGTTCSATLIFAALAGIKVFATGGLGGVHRGGENSMDVSADLMELTRCPVGLVSSGVKSILDIGRTLEYLETLGVPVVTYGTSSEFPAFFSRHSGFNAPWNVKDPMSAASILHTQWQLGMENGALIAVPIPAEFEEAGMSIQEAVDQAVAESEQNGINKRGKEATPWLLSRINELTRGKSLLSNIALLENTALVGGNIAVQYHKLVYSKGNIPSSTWRPIHAPLVNLGQVKTSVHPANLVIVGSAAVDITARTRPDTDKTLASHSTAPGSISLSLGGVARNIAEAAHRVIKSQSSHMSSVLVAPIGDDSFGRILVDEMTKIGMRIDGLVQSDQATAVCNMVLDGSGGLIGGVADMDITSSFSGDIVTSHLQANNPSLVALDGNLSPDTIKSVVGYCSQNKIKVFFEPTSVVKSTAILPAIAAHLDNADSEAPIAYCSPNLFELAHLDQSSRAEPFELTSHLNWWRIIDHLSLGSEFRRDLEQLARKQVVEGDPSKGTLSFLVDRGIAQMAVKLLPFIQHLIIKCGDQGALVVMRISGEEARTSPWANMRSQPSQRYITARGTSNEMVVLQHFPPHTLTKDIVNVTGAGDSFVGALLAILLEHPGTFQDPQKLNNAICIAQDAAMLSLQSHHAVSSSLC